jgi:hypothetical protein
LNVSPAIIGRCMAAVGAVLSLRPDADVDRIRQDG